MRSLILLAVLAAGCGLHKPYLRTDTNKPARQCHLPVLVGISQGTPDELIVSINSAVDYWNDVIPGLFFNYGELPLTANERDAFTIIQIVPSESLWSEFWGTCGETKVIMNNYTGCIKYTDIQIADKCTDPPEMFESVVRHELGHVLGLNESIDDRSIMSPGYSARTKHPARANEEQIQTLRGFYVKDEEVH